jgi:hypothetical protein
MSIADRYPGDQVAETISASICEASLWADKQSETLSKPEQFGISSSLSAQPSSMRAHQS